MADCCFPADRRSVDGGMTSQLARLHAVPPRPGKGAADRRRSSSSVGEARPASCRAPVSGRPLCHTHNSVVPVAFDLTVDVALAIMREQHYRAAIADCSSAETAASRRTAACLAERRCR